MEGRRKTLWSSSAATRAELSCSAHATEDEGKVLAALLNVVPENLREQYAQAVETTRTMGYHGNPITIYRLVVEGPDANKIFEHVASSLSEEDREYVDSTLSDRLEGRKLYIRVSKQWAYLGRLKVYEGDDVIKIIFTLRRSRAARTPAGGHGDVQAMQV